MLTIDRLAGDFNIQKNIGQLMINAASMAALFRTGVISAIKLIDGVL
jgi:hypothetical protein